MSAEPELHEGEEEAPRGARAAISLPSKIHRWEMLRGFKPKAAEVKNNAARNHCALCGALVASLWL